MSERPDEPSTGSSTLVVQASLPARIADQGPVAPLVSGPQAWIDREIDDYHILRVIDAGGMGVVFLAEQHHPKRLVAIKTLHAGLHQPEMLARFQQEAEILGRLKHPGIAQIFASGRTDATLGLVPYIVMEYVEGSPLLEFCRGIGVRERLAILMRVCTAVEHAHIRGVIHRDLKPGNILVQPDGQTKVLDFGVARLTGEDQGSSELTTAGMLIGTIAYMSPEQAVGEPGAVDIRTDVYALGMIGYRMLTDSLPYDVSASSLAHALQQICETPPRPLSQHGAQYAGDLTTIFDKALAKDKAARYQNAAELSEDLRRYLADEAILARPPSTLSEMRRFARRNKALVGASVMVLLALIGAVGVSTWFALEEQAQRRQTDVTLNFMRYTFSSANPVLARGRVATMKDAMDQRVPAVELELADAPAARGRLRSYFAEPYMALGELELALELYRAAGADFRVAGVGGSELGLVRVGEARALLDSGRTREARDLLQAQVDETSAGERSAPAVMSRLHLAVALAQMGEDVLAETAFDDGFAQLERDAALPCPTCLPDWDARLEVWALSKRAQFEREAGRLERALVSAQHAVDVAEKRLDPNDADALVALTNLSLVLGDTGHLAKARALVQRAYDDRVRLLGNEHFQSLIAADNLATALRAEGKAVEAETLYRSSLEIATQALDPQDPELSTLKSNLASLLNDAGRLDEAEVLFADAYASRKLRLGPNHPTTLTNAMNLAVLYTRRQKFDLAKPLFQQALAGTEARFGQEHRNSIAVLSEYASFLRDRGQFSEADANFEQAWKTAAKLLPAGDSDRLRVLYQFSGSLQKQGRYAEAEQISARLLDEAKITKDPSALHALLAPARHAKSLIGLDRSAEAETLLLALDRKLDGPAYAQYRRITRESLAGIYRASGREAEAERLLGAE